MQNSKKILRDQARKIREEIPESRRTHDAKALKSNVIAGLVPIILENSMEDYPNKSGNDKEFYIATYYPIGNEIHPPHELNGYRLALPVIRNKTTLEFYEWDDSRPVVKRDFDIPIPDTRGQQPVLPDIILLPLLLCDQYGNRIGYGAGHYDRYIASLDYKPLLIGVCFDEQVAHEALPAEPHDVRLDLIITPKRVIETA